MPYSDNLSLPADFFLICENSNRIMNDKTLRKYYLNNISYCYESNIMLSSILWSFIEMNCFMFALLLPSVYISSFLIACFDLLCLKILS